MKEIGEYLRQVRTEKNISLNDIQEATKIRKHYLEAIENGDFEAIPGEVYRKGFLVNYANAIGLDGQEILARYNQAKQPKIEPNIPEIKKEAKPVRKSEKPVKKPEPVIDYKSVNQPEQVEQVKKKTSTRIRLTNSTHLWVSVVIITVIIVAIVAGWSVMPLIKESVLKTNQTSNVEKSPAKVPVAAPKPGQNDVPSVSESPEATATPDTVSTQIYPAPVTIKADFSEDVWVQVMSDGKPIFIDDGQTFHADSPTQIWTAQKDITITIGNPAGIKLYLNGDLGICFVTARRPFLFRVMPVSFRKDTFF